MTEGNAESAAAPLDAADLEAESIAKVDVNSLDPKHQLEVWKEVLRVQQHFNDLGMRVRALMVTIITLVLGATGVVYANSTAMRWGPWTVSLAAMVPLLGLVPTWALWRLDARWYHVLLGSAVDEAKRLEDELQQLNVHVRVGRRVRTLHLRARSNLHVFYGTFATVLVLISAALLVLGPFRPA